MILFSIDTLRADAVGAYGGAVPTPTLDALAREGVLFEQAYAPAPETAPSHATLFSGQDVLRHGLVRNGDPLPEGLPLLPEALRAAGWSTAGFVSSFVLDPRFGWSRGFESFDAALSARGATMHPPASYEGRFWQRFRFEGFDRRAFETTRAARGFLAQAREPFFLFVHLFDPHAPYVPPDAYTQRLAGIRLDLEGRSVRGITPRLLEGLVRSYHGEVLYADDAVAGVLEALRARGLHERTLVVLTADHGEGLGQHGWLEHGLYLYDEQLRVPLIFVWPGVLPAGTRLRTPVGLVDVAPTLAELTGIRFPGASDGRSLAASLRSGREPEARGLLLYRRPYRGAPPPERGEKWALRSEGWKYLRSTGRPDELYDLAGDPGELRDLAPSRAELTRRLAGELDARLSALPKPAQAGELSEETKERLRALGYAE